MRGGGILGAWLLGLGLTWAAPAPHRAPPPAPASPALQAEAGVFASTLIGAAARVSVEYARPVEVADLVGAALTGLYEAAGKPPPRGLRDGRHRTVVVPLMPPPIPVAPRPPVVDTAVLEDPELTQFALQAYLDTAGAEGLRGKHSVLVALRAMTASLDPYTVVLPVEELSRQPGLNSEYIGVGVEVEDSRAGEAVPIRAVHPGSPAQKAGLRPGDEIVRLDGQPVGSLALDNLRARLRLVAPDPNEAGPIPEEPLKLTLRRRGSAGERTVALTPTQFRLETVLGVAREEDGRWDYWLDRRRGIAQVRLGPLTTGTAAELRDVLLRLREGGLRGLVLDLRWCPGGLISEATRTAELFLGQVEIARTKERREDRVFRSTGEPKFQDLPLLVLINGATSGGGELIAAALQDHAAGRIWVAGQRSLGKGSIQTSVTLHSANLAMKVTSGTFFRSTGKNLNRFPDSRPQDDWGVLPDSGLEFRISQALQKQLRQWWLLQTLRPGSSDEALPLDDPEADPQRQAALEALLARLDGKARAKGD
jgi:carboxyl-terminal processing protease